MQNFRRYGEVETFKTLADIKKRGVGGAQKVKGKGSVNQLKFKTKEGKTKSYKGGFGGHY
jgi:hypothetical protein